MRRYFGWFLGAVCSAELLLASAGAVAQTATPAATAAPAATATAPDVIVLKDGSRYRGTIAELVKDGPITIVLITGETRKLMSADVAYAGPAAGEPPPATPWPPVVSAEAVVAAPAAPLAAVADAPDEAPAAGSKLVRVRFTANRVGSEVFVRQADRRYRKICTAPCVSDFEPDVYGIGVRFNKDAQVKPLQDVMLDQPATLAVDYRSRDGLRGAGGLVLGLGLVLSAVSGFYLLVAERPNTTVGLLGLGSGVAGGVVGISLLSVGDAVGLTAK
jgi:hypothetical protein